MSDHHVAGMRIRVHKTRVENLLGKDAQHFTVHVSHAQAGLPNSLAVADLDPLKGGVVDPASYRYW